MKRRLMKLLGCIAVIALLLCAGCQVKQAPSAKLATEEEVLERALEVLQQEYGTKIQNIQSYASEAPQFQKKADGFWRVQFRAIFTEDETAYTQSFWVDMDAYGEQAELAQASNRQLLKDFDAGYLQTYQ